MSGTDAVGFAGAHPTMQPTPPPTSSTANLIERIGGLSITAQFPSTADSPVCVTDPTTRRDMLHKQRHKHRHSAAFRFRPYGGPLTAADNSDDSHHQPQLAVNNALLWQMGSGMKDADMRPDDPAERPAVVASVVIATTRSMHDAGYWQQTMQQPQPQTNSYFHTDHRDHERKENDQNNHLSLHRYEQQQHLPDVGSLQQPPRQPQTSPPWEQSSAHVAPAPAACASATTITHSTPNTNSIPQNRQRLHITPLTVSERRFLRMYLPRIVISPAVEGSPPRVSPQAPCLSRRRSLGQMDTTHASLSDYVNPGSQTNTSVGHDSDTYDDNGATRAATTPVSVNPSVANPEHGRHEYMLNPWLHPSILRNRSCPDLVLGADMAAISLTDHTTETTTTSHIPASHMVS